MSYVANFYKNVNTEDDSNYEAFFNAYQNDDNLKNVEKRIQSLLKEIDKVKRERNCLLAARYNAECVPIEQDIVVKYESTRGNGRHYYLLKSGVEITGNEAHEIGALIVDIDKKRVDCLPIVYGYCYELAAVVVRGYRISISQSCDTMKAVLVKEGIISLLTKNSSYMDYCENNIATYELDEGLNNIEAKNFLETFYGQEFDIPTIHLSDIKRFYRHNKSSEIILKTAPASVVLQLLSMKCDKSLPLYKFIGCTAADLAYAKEKGVEEDYISFKHRQLSIVKDSYDGEHMGISIQNIEENFDLSQKQWIDFIERCKGWREDLDFYQIEYKDCLWEQLLSEYIGKKYKSSPYYRSKFNYSTFYPFYKFCSYVVEETINQGYTSVANFLDILRDYLSMCHQMDVKPTLYTNQLHQSHDIIARNNKIKVNEEQEESFAKQYEDFKEWRDGNGYVVVAPKTSKDLQQEGNNLNHCVASYIKKVCDGSTKILFLRLLSDVTTSLITFEVRNRAIVQVKGMSNRKPVSEERDALLKYAKKNSLDYDGK